ncbi:acyltransferase family protein [Lelliottia nimipressuralis]|uniref:acyltransferase family protein n=1 Tax=Lelliottia nimipressuralis TaxID=69220 RepID=UPI003D2AECC7
MPWADTLKALGMLCIYIGHFGPVSGKLYSFVFLFHVPLFFFISGFFHSNKSSVVEFSINRFKKIVVPYLIFSVLSLFFFSLRAPEYVKDISYTVQAIAFGVRNTTYYAEGLWFLPCLFIMSLVFRLLSSITNRVFLLSALLSVSCLVIFPNMPSSDPRLWFNIDSAMQYIIYYACGFSFRQHVGLYIKDDKPTNIFSVVVFISLLLIAFIYTKGTSFITLAIGKFALLNYLTSVSITLVAIILCIFIALHLSHLNLINNIGKGSIILCGTENICRGILITAISTMGLSVKFSNPLSIVLLSITVMMISRLVFFPVFHSLIVQPTKTVPALGEKRPL